VQANCAFHRDFETHRCKGKFVNRTEHIRTQ
jgi:hypothetical protein